MADRLIYQLIINNMAKIVLRTNLVNKNVSVPSVSVDAQQGEVPNPVEITITPAKGYILDAKQVTHGMLPGQIRYVDFYKSTGSAVKAKIEFFEYNSLSPITIIDLPLSVITRKEINAFALTETTSTDANVLVDETTSLQKDSNLGNKNTYIVQGEPGSTINIISKTFSTPDGYYFSKPPTYNITGDKSRYKVLINETTNAKGKLISKTFNISYNFSNSVINSNLRPTISFSATSKKEAELVKDKPVKTKKDGKIYSINVSKGLSKVGGVKRISIKGVPGTHFKVLAQNKDGNLYNFKTGGTTEGGFIEGVIPGAKRNMPYGEYIQAIKLDSVATADNFNVKLSTEAEIDHKKLAEYLVDKTKQREGIFETTERIEANAGLTIALKDGGPVDTSETPDGHPGLFNVLRPVRFKEEVTATPTIYNGINYVYNGTHVIGDGIYKKSISTFMQTNPVKLESGQNSAYTFLISAGSLDAPDKGIQINRAPIFAKTGYLRWDFTTYVGFGGSYKKQQNVAGTEILSDFGTSIRHSVTSDTSDGTDIDYETNDWNIRDIKVSVEGLEPVGEYEDSPEDANVYRYVALTFENIEGTFGKDDLTIELNLKNFLSTRTY